MSTQLQLTDISYHIIKVDQEMAACSLMSQNVYDVDLIDWVTLELSNFEVVAVVGCYPA
jgi:hypothetical protein